MKCNDCWKISADVANCKFNCGHCVCNDCFERYHQCDECVSLCSRNETPCDFCYDGDKHIKLAISTPTHTLSYHDDLSDTYYEGRCLLRFVAMCMPRLLYACCKCLKTNPVVLSSLKNPPKHEIRMHHKVCNVCKVNDICLEQVLLQHTSTKTLYVKKGKNDLFETYSVSCKGCQLTIASCFLEKLDVGLAHFHHLQSEFCCKCLITIINFNFKDLLHDLKQIVLAYF